MATKKEKTITKKDIADFRELVEIQKKFHKITTALSKKLDCDFYELSEWSDRLGKMNVTTDEHVAFAMGRLSLHDF